MLPFEHVRCPLHRLTARCAILVVTALPTYALAADEPSAFDVVESYEVAETAAAGTVVGRPSIEQGVHFAIVAGNDDGVFAIDHRTGTLSVRRSDVLDHESRPEITVTIDVTTSWPADDETSWRYLARLLERKRDLAAVLEHRTVRTTIAVTDVNEPPVVESTRIDVASDVEGDVVGRCSLRDAEDGVPATVRVVNEAPFTIDANGVVRWQPGRRLRSLDEQTYTVAIEAVDSAGATGQGACEIVVHPSVGDLAATLTALQNADSLASWAAESGLERLALPWVGTRVDAIPSRAVTNEDPATATALPAGELSGTDRGREHGRTARGIGAVPSQPDRAGWNVLLIGLAGCSFGFLATALLGRSRLRRIERANRERQSVLTSESERYRSETKAATHSRDEALETCRRAEEERDRLASERADLADRVEQLGEDLERSRREAAAVCVSAASPAESVGALCPLVPGDETESETDLPKDDCANPIDDFLFDLVEDAPVEPDSPSVIASTEDALDADVEYLDLTAATEPTGTVDLVHDASDPCEWAHTEILHVPGESALDNSDTVKLAEQATSAEPGRPSEADNPAAVELRKYLAAQFELDEAPTPSHAAEGSEVAPAGRSASGPVPVESSRAYDTLSGLADRLDALAEPSASSSRTAVLVLPTPLQTEVEGDGDDVLDFTREDSATPLTQSEPAASLPPSSMAPAESTTPASVAHDDAAADTPTGDTTGDADDKYASVEAYMSRLLGKSKDAEPRQDPMTERQAERLASITATDGAVNRERRARRRTNEPDESDASTDGDAESPDAPVHSIDKEGERERMQSMRTVANKHANQSLESFRRRFRVRQYKTVLTLVGLVAVVVAVGWYLLA